MVDEKSNSGLASSTLSEQVETQIEHDVFGSGSKTEVYEIKDASSESAKVLVPQIGSDQSWLMEGRNDYRRFTHIKPLDVLWLSWFSNKRKEQGGRWCEKFIEAFCNFCYSINGENKKLVIAMQQAIKGEAKEKEKKDDRSFIQRHFTQRGKKPEKEYYEV